ncbi:LOB domain-containing protein 6-like [Panicum virgatum]|uniref:LOB domain-containing protein 6-like n=1 Tax=Panicum virgatum TaxID=38727 RepID=UPI0019D5E65A|nr:LOB domain-containing protein 6-like [Panicum virgatum]
MGNLSGSPIMLAPTKCGDPVCVRRRKCNPDCPLAPYFPADQQRRFLNAHRLFGVKNIQRTLRWIDPERGPDAMRALIYQSEARAADPVGGCVTIIEQLQRQIERTELELAYVKQQIAFYRQAAAVDPLADPAMILPPPDAAAAVAGQDHQDNAAAVAVGALYAGQEPVPPGAAGLVFQDQQGYHHHHVLKADQQNHPPPQQLYNYFCYDGTAADESTQDGSVQQFGGFADTGGLKIGSPTLATLGEQLEQQCQLDAFDVKPPGLRATTERLGPADELMRPAEDHHDVDQHMEEPATAVAAPCHLELGFSSF